MLRFVWFSNYVCCSDVICVCVRLYMCMFVFFVFDASGPHNILYFVCALLFCFVLVFVFLCGLFAMVCYFLIFVLSVLFCFVFFCFVDGVSLLSLFQMCLGLLPVCVCLVASMFLLLCVVHAFDWSFV